MNMNILEILEVLSIFITIILIIQYVAVGSRAFIRIYYGYNGITNKLFYLTSLISIVFAIDISFAILLLTDKMGYNYFVIGFSILTILSRLLLIFANVSYYNKIKKDIE